MLYNFPITISIIIIIITSFSRDISPTICQSSPGDFPLSISNRLGMFYMPSLGHHNPQLHHETVLRFVGSTPLVLNSSVSSHVPPPVAGWVGEREREFFTSKVRSAFRIAASLNQKNFALRQASDYCSASYHQEKIPHRCRLTQSADFQFRLQIWEPYRIYSSAVPYHPSTVPYINLYRNKHFGFCGC